MGKTTWENHVGYKHVWLNVYLPSRVPLTRTKSVKVQFRLTVFGELSKRVAGLFWYCAQDVLLIKTQYCCALAITRPSGHVAHSITPRSWSQPVPGSANRRSSALDKRGAQYLTRTFFSQSELFHFIGTDPIINIAASHYFVEGELKATKKLLWQWMWKWPIFTFKEEFKLLLILLDLQHILVMKVFI